MYLPELAQAGPGRCAVWRCDRRARADPGARARTRRAALPPYDEKLLRFEMSLFPDWLLQRHLGLDAFQRTRRGAGGTPWTRSSRTRSSNRRCSCIATTTRATSWSARTTTRASSISRTPCAAALTYDLVSLLRDSYIAWPQERVVGWALQYRREARGRRARHRARRGAVPALVRPDGRAAPAQGRRASLRGSGTATARRVTSPTFRAR